MSGLNLITMKNIINWKLFFILLAACTASTLLVLPYTFSLSPALRQLMSSAVLAAAVIQSLVLFSVAIFFGLLLAKRVGFGLPVLERALIGEDWRGYLKGILWKSIGWGVLAGVLIILLSLPFPDLSVVFLKSEASVSLWKGFLASFYGGIGEEVFFRLFLTTLFVWILVKIRKTGNASPSRLVVWLSIILASVLFGLGHLGITSDLTAITPLVVLRAVLLNGVGGIIFGWLYWKKGLESAIIAHFSADIVLHVVTPFVASIFL